MSQQSVRCRQCSADLSPPEIATYGGLCELCATTPMTTLDDGTRVARGGGGAPGSPGLKRGKTARRRAQHGITYHGFKRGGE